MADTEGYEPFPESEEERDVLNAAAREQAEAPDAPKPGRSLVLRGGNDTAREMTAETLKGFSFADLEGLQLDVVDASEGIGTDQYGPVLSNEQKDRLIGVPFVLMYWEFNKGDYGVDFVTAFVLTKDDQKYILNDGSTGVRAQLQHLTATKGITSMLVCRNGLRKSVYDTDIEVNGKTVHVTDATTYYIDTKL